MQQWDRLWRNVHLATMAGEPGDYGILEQGAIAVLGERIAWLGRERDLPAAADSYATEVIDGAGRWVTPGLIDCHTHLVFGGDRADEFEQRLEGVSYEEIARRGGGIRATVTATRAASTDLLVDSAAGRLRGLLAEGVTTVEIKSGYGLDTDTELRMLHAASTLGKNLPVEVHPTFLGAHAPAAGVRGAPGRVHRPGL